MRFPLVVALSAALVAAPALAYTCTGLVTELSIDAGGRVYFSGSGGIQRAQVCQIGATTQNGIASDTCKAIYAGLMAANLSGTAVTSYFSDTLTCTTHPQWALLTGLTFGPGVGFQ
jgi:hypothetical protein